MGRKVLSFLVVLLFLFSIIPVQSYADDSVITDLEITLTAPVTGAVPVTSITSTNSQYTADVLWNGGTPAAFDPGTAYTATITITPKAGYTVTGIGENVFKVNGAIASNSANSNTVVYTFPATELIVITDLTIALQAPVKGETPVTSITSPNGQYTGTVTWSDSPAFFETDKIYTANIQIIPNSGFTLNGVGADKFLVSDASSTTNLANDDKVIAVFPVTESVTKVSTSAIAGVNAPVIGETPVTSVLQTNEYSGVVEWSGSPTVFAASTVYTATITLTPKYGYTFTGIDKNYFKVSGANATNDESSNIIAATFPITDPESPILVSAETNSAGNIITLGFDKEMADPSGKEGSFIVKINGFSYNWSQFDGSPTSKSIGISSASLNADLKKINLTLTNPIYRGDILTVDYVPGTVASSDTAKLKAFVNFAVTNNVPVIFDTNLPGTWKAYDHVGNWQEMAYETAGFTGIADDTRGNTYNRHIIIQGTSVYFFGNGVWPFKDFLYLPSNQAAAKSFSFDLDLGGIKYHSMEGGGFLFNSSIVNNVLSGYCLLFMHQSEYDYTLHKYVDKYKAKLFEITGINVDNFHDGKSPFINLQGNSNNGIKELGTFNLPNTNKHSIKLEASADTLDLWDGSSKLIDTFSLPNEYSFGVGIIGSYQSHDCSELSYFVFSGLNIQGVADLAAVINGGLAGLTFTAPEGATSVSVEQSTDGSTWVPAIATPINATSTTATISGLSTNQKYYFRLVITGGKYSGYSRIATAIETEEVITPVVTPVVAVPTPEPIIYTLVVEKTGEGTTGPEPGSRGYQAGTVVVFMVKPAESWQFDGWTGDKVTDGRITMDGNKSITAVFSKIGTTPTVTVTPEPAAAAEVEEATPEPVAVVEEAAPAAEAELPKTAGIPSALIYSFGGVLVSIGVVFRKKLK